MCHSTRIYIMNKVRKKSLSVYFMMKTFDFYWSATGFCFGQTNTLLLLNQIWRTCLQEDVFNEVQQRKKCAPHLQILLQLSSLLRHRFELWVGSRVDIPSSLFYIAVLFIYLFLSFRQINSAHEKFRSFLSSAIVYCRAAKFIQIS